MEGKELDLDRSMLDVTGSTPFLIMNYAPRGTLQRRAKRLSHITSSFPDQEEDTRNAETIPAHPER